MEHFQPNEFNELYFQELITVFKIFRSCENNLRKEFQVENGEDIIEEADKFKQIIEIFNFMLRKIQPLISKVNEKILLLKKGLDASEEIIKIYEQETKMLEDNFLKKKENARVEQENAKKGYIAGWNTGVISDSEDEMESEFKVSKSDLYNKKYGTLAHYSNVRDEIQAQKPKKSLNVPISAQTDPPISVQNIRKVKASGSLAENPYEKMGVLKPGFYAQQSSKIANKNNNTGNKRKASGTGNPQTTRKKNTKNDNLIQTKLTFVHRKKETSPKFAIKIDPNDPFND